MAIVVLPDIPTSDSHGLVVGEITGFVPAAPITTPISNSEAARREGTWARVEVSGNRAQLLVDRPRSFPLFYARRGEDWIVGSDAARTAAAAGLTRRSERGAAALLHCGHTLGSDTLFQNLYTVPAGSRVQLEPNGAVTQEVFSRFRYPDTRVSDDAEYEEMFSAAMDAVLTRALNHIGDRRIAIPLSGGIDSRLLLAWLQQLGAGKIIAFTYGTAGAQEVEVSRRVAAEAGVEWHCVETKAADIADRWNSSPIHDFLADTWSGTALPHVQDWWALTRLLEDSVLAPGDVVMPGHTVVGNMHHAQMLDWPDPDRAIQRAVEAQHWTFRGKRPRAGMERSIVDGAIESAKQEVAFDGSRATTQACIEWFGARERQAKYINNSVRAYEHFGLEWAMPMLEPELWDVCMVGDEAHSVDRGWYATLTNRIWREATGSDLAFHTALKTSLSPGAREVLLSILRKTRGDRVLSRYFSVRTQLRHPMAFEAYAASVPTRRSLPFLARGGLLFGLWTELFLERSWGNQGEIVPPR